MSENVKLTDVIQRDSRYAPAAYLFIFESLDFTIKKIGARRHVSGKELLEGIRENALRQFGALAPMVFDQWGIKQCVDFGRIVFNLVESGLMGKTENDSIDDFKEGYDFKETFSFERASGRNAGEREQK